MVVHSSGAEAIPPSLLMKQAEFFSLLPSDLSRANPISPNSIVSSTVIAPEISKVLSLVAFLTDSWAAALHAQHSD